MSITIAPAVPADGAAVLEYLKKVGGESENLTFGAEGVPFTVTQEEAYIASLAQSPDNIMLLAKENGRIVGDASLSRMPRRMGHRGDLGVAVLKSHWNMGIGGRLIAAVIEFAKANGFGAIDLQVRSDNVAAIHLYEKLGFVKIGRHPDFFRINGEAIAFDYMTLHLE